MRKLMIITTMLLLLVTTALTAQQRHGQRGPEKELFSELDLTADQQQKMKALREESKQKMQALRKSAADERPSREDMKKLREEARTEMESVLTPEQRTKLAELKAARKKAMDSVDKEALKADLQKAREEAKEVISAARGQLDAFISPEDKTAIARLRTVYATNPMAAKRKKADRRQRPERTDRPDREAHKAAAQEWKEEHKEDIAEAKALAEKYSADITRIWEKLAPQMEKWEEQKREIIASYMPEGMMPKHKAQEHAKGKGKKGKKDRAARAGSPDSAKRKGQGRKSVGFLLMES